MIPSSKFSGCSSRCWPEPVWPPTPTKKSQAGRQPCYPAKPQTWTSGAYPEEYPPHRWTSGTGGQGGCHTVQAYGRGSTFQAITILLWWGFQWYYTFPLSRHFSTTLPSPKWSFLPRSKCPSSHSSVHRVDPKGKICAQRISGGNQHQSQYFKYDPGGISPNCKIWKFWRVWRKYCKSVGLLTKYRPDWFVKWTKSSKRCAGKR